jgi:endonuclease YncB( thermonuclease family)
VEITEGIVKGLDKVSHADRSIPFGRKVKARNHLVGAMFASLLGMVLLQQAIAQADISSFAFVQDDGSLKVAGYLIHLYGIYIPPTDQTCYTFIRPIPCGTRASLALDFKISGDFVHCVERASGPDGSITASCRVGEEELSEWMLQHGWAVALPDAPFEYAAMERIAQSRGIGIWGIPVDANKQRRR